ncbi:MAG: helix-turn-helix domain-containing protein, partial [Nitrososphaeraceae archaeon]
MRRKLDEWKVTDICKTIKISRTSFYRYRNKYQKDGFEVLKDKFRRPHTNH